MASVLDGTCFDYVGVEIETVITTQDEVNRWRASLSEVLPRIYKKTFRTVTRDASVEAKIRRVTPRFSVYAGGDVGVVVSRGGGFPSSHIDTSGMEFITLPTDPDSLFELTKRLFNFLVKNGEIESPRAAYHVHVGYPHSVSMLRKALIVGEKVEPLLYRLAGLGNAYRGIINCSAYCRPLTMPSAVPTDTDSYVVLNPLRGRTASDLKEFWSGYAITFPGNNSGRGYTRHHPARYMGLNLYGVLLRGALEYRYWNLTLNPVWATAIAKLCLGLTETMALYRIGDFEGFPELNLLEEPDDNKYGKALEMLISRINSSNNQNILNNDTARALMDIFESTPPSTFIDDGPVLTHLARDGDRDQRRFILARPASFMLEEVPRSVVKASGFVDIHNFDASKIPLLGEE